MLPLIGVSTATTRASDRMNTAIVGQTFNFTTVRRSRGANPWRSAWREARMCFMAALGDEETPEALDGLGVAAWRRGGVAAWRCRLRSNCTGAARVATHLAIEHFLYRGEYVSAN